jgi:hypothetical protein
MDHDTLMIVHALLSLKTPRVDKPAMKKKQRKTLIRENRAKAIKVWHEEQRKIKDIKNKRSARISAWMKAAWAKRKTS